MVRAPSIDKNGMKKGAWSEEEDNKLRAYILRYGHWNWRQLPKFAGVARCGKSCRLRWLNYLQPNVKRGNYTKEEEDLILKLHNDLGNKWSAIAAKLPGRSDNDIKNYWHTNLKTRAKQNSSCLSPEIECGGSPESSREQNDQNIETSLSDVNEVNITINDYSFELSPSTESSPEFFNELNDDIWADPFFSDFTNELFSPLRNNYISPPSPVMVQDFLWSYDLHSYE